ncbi:hypothetical protein BDZ89DRAFT_1076343 [Hymenopellis radicata]|nr:hypothetical protein BDZ89DRAFT_1076343 [Hymenopellis radicata]
MPANNYSNNTAGLKFPPIRDPFPPSHASQFPTLSASFLDPPHPAEDDLKQSISAAIATFKKRCTETEIDLRKELEDSKKRERQLATTLWDMVEQNAGLIARNREVDKELKDVISRLQRCAEHERDAPPELLPGTSDAPPELLPGTSTRHRDVSPQSPRPTSKRSRDHYDVSDDLYPMSSSSKSLKTSHHHKSRCRH